MCLGDEDILLLQLDRGGGDLSVVVTGSAPTCGLQQNSNVSLAGSLSELRVLCVCVSGVLCVCVWG